MKPDQMTKDERIEIARKVTKELVEKGVTDEAVAGFEKLMGPEKLEEFRFSFGPPHFGTAPLPDADW